MSRLIASLFATALFATAAAHEFKAGALEIHHPWARASIPGASNGAVYLKINNAGEQADALLGVEAGKLADMAELHTMSMDNGVMKMRPLERLAVPAKGSAMLKPGGDHLMLFGLKQTLKTGDKVPLTLRFEKAGTVKIEVKIEPLDANAEAMHAGH